MPLLQRLNLEELRANIIDSEKCGGNACHEPGLGEVECLREQVKVLNETLVKLLDIMIREAMPPQSEAMRRYWGDSDD